MTVTERFAPIRAAWADRTSREQGLLMLAAALLAAILIWYALLAPALNWRAQAERDFQGAVERFEVMVEGTARHQALSAGAARRTGAGGAPLRTVIGRTANARGVAISRVQPLDDGRLAVWFDSVEADALMVWLSELTREAGVRVDRVSLDREGEGQVRAQLLLAGPES
jgi:type II secretory pathway component PulM